MPAIGGDEGVCCGGRQPGQGAQGLVEAARHHRLALQLSGWVVDHALRVARIQQALSRWIDVAAGLVVGRGRRWGGGPAEPGGDRTEGHHHQDLEGRVRGGPTTSRHLSLGRLRLTPLGGAVWWQAGCMSRRLFPAPDASACITALCLLDVVGSSRSSTTPSSAPPSPSAPVR